MDATRAKALLRDGEATAVALVRACRALLGDFIAWEPESAWLELDRQGVDVPEANRARIGASVALLLVPSFYWDGVVFGKTAIALDGLVVQPDLLEEATPAQMAWAVVEAAWVIHDTHNATWTFESEPRGYAGVVLHRAGFVLAPATLDFAQRALDRENASDVGALRDRVGERWSRVSADHLDKLQLTEDPVDVQIARLAAVELHVRARRERARRDLGESA